MLRHINKNKKSWLATLLVSIFALAFFVTSFSTVRAATIGPNNPSVGADDATVGTITWSTTGNIFSSNNSYATATLNDNEISHYVKATGFGFAVPAGATINGITAEVEKKSSNASRIEDYRVRIIKGGTIGATDRANTGVFWGTADAYTTYGSTSDLWGESWTYSDINSANFGLAFSAFKNSTAGGGTTASVDHIRITITYTPDTTSPTVTINQAGGQADPTNGAINFTAVFSESVTPTFATGDVSFTGSTAPGTLVGTVSGGPTTYNIAVTGMTGSGNVVASIGASVATDIAGNPNTASTSTDNSVAYDTTPSTGTITLGGGATYWTTNTSPTIALTTDDAAQYQLCLNSATAGNACTSVARAWAAYTASPAPYDLASQGSQTLYVQFKDALGNISATTSDLIIIDTVAPSVTINQSGGQADPTTNPIINFTAVFSEAINPATFDATDITTSGTATGVTWSAPTTSDNITWTVSTSAVGAGGTVIPSIDASKVTDVAGNNNTASTSTDNSVTYTGTYGISGTSDLASGTVAVAVNGVLQAQTGTISAGNWTINGVAIAANDNIVVWVDGAFDADESTAVTREAAIEGAISGMVLNRHVLSIGSSTNQSLTLSNLGLYDADQDEDIMYSANSSILNVDATGSSYTDEKIDILSGDTLTISGTETLNTFHLTITGTLVSGGASIYSVAGNWTNNGTFTESSSTVTFNSAGTSALTGLSTTTFNNLTISSGTLDLSSFTANGSGSGTLTISNGATLKIGGSGTLPSSYSTHSIGITSTVEYAGTATTVATPNSSQNYGNLVISGSAVTTTASFTIATSLSVTGSLVASAGAITMSSGASVANSGTLTFNNLTSAGGSISASGDFTINGVLTLTGNISTSGTVIMGASATTTGAGDVVGITKRTTLLSNTDYTFGSQFTVMRLIAGGTLPTDMSVKLVLTSPTGPTWKTTAVKRYYDIVYSGSATGNTMVARLHYTDSELQANNESNMVLWDRHVVPAIHHEHGKSAPVDTTNNWVELSGLNTSYVARTSFDNKYWFLAETENVANTWLGISTDWDDISNWSAGSIPTATSIVAIPDTANTPNAPTLPATADVLTLELDPGAVLNGGSGTLTLHGDGGALFNEGGTINPGTSTFVFNDTNATITGTNNLYNLIIDTGATLTNETGSITRIAGAVTNNGTWNADGLVNTVEYNGGAQTIINPNGSSTRYHSLILSGSGIKDLPNSAIEIHEDFIISGTASVTADSAITMGTDTVTTPEFILESGATFNAGAFTHNVKGAWTNNGGTFTAGSSTINFNGTVAQSIGGSASTTFNNLTINNSTGVTGSGNFAVNGVLTLTTSMDMGANTLTMGSSATTSGSEDVFGITKRTSIVATTVYSFGSQFTTIAFDAVGTLPTEVSMKLVSGAPVWKSDAITRYYDIIQSGGSGFAAAIKLHYQDSELNGNTESELDFWHRHVTMAETEEHGRSNTDFVNNQIGLSNIGSAVISSSFGDYYWTLANKTNVSRVWDGDFSSDWTDPANWLGGIPGSTDDVVIPAGTPFDPILPASTEIKTLVIQSGAVLNGGSGTTLTINGDGGAMINGGGTINPDTSTIIFTGTAATISGTNDFYNLTVDTGADLTMDTGSIIRIGGAIINNGIWRTTMGGVTTVEYSGASQTVVIPNPATNRYYDLILSGSGTKTMPATALEIIRDFTISGTATVNAGGALTVDRNFTLNIGATFNAGSYTHNIKGDWSNGGTFNADTSTVNFNGTGAQTINSDNSWYGLSITTSIARTVSFQSAKTQTILPNGSLTFTGASGNLLTLVPLTPASAWLLDVDATGVTQNINYTSPSYSDASAGTGINAVDAGTNVDGGNNINWDLSALGAVTNVTSSATNGFYKIGTLVPIPISVTFNKIVNVTGTPQLTLETGGTNYIADYASGTGSNTLVFNYTVQAGDEAGDLDYVGTGSLALNGGTIKDTSGNNASLTLPSPGSVGSLGANKAIVIDTTAPSGLTALVAGVTGSVSQALSWTAVTETNFDHYEIWSGTNQTKVQNRDASGGDGAVIKDDTIYAPLAIRTQQTVSIDSLVSGTTYYYKIWAVDSAGNEETVADISTTTGTGNAVPTASAPTNIQQLTDGSGYVSFQTTVSDIDSQDTKLGGSFSEDGGLTWRKFYIVSATEDVAGTIDINNSNIFQVGDANLIDTSLGPVVLTVIWDSKSALNQGGGIDGTDQSDIQIRYGVSDGLDTGTIMYSGNFQVDNIAPSGYGVSIDQATINNSNKTNASFTFSGAEVGATYNYSINDTNGATPAVTGSGTIVGASQQITGIDVSSLDDGTLTFIVYLTDAIGGNQGSNATDTVSKSTVGPIVNITSPVSGDFVNASKIISFTTNDSNNLECSIDNSNWTPCASDTTMMGDIPEFVALGETTFALYLRDTDTNSNIGTDSELGITKDITDPIAPGFLVDALSATNVAVTLNLGLAGSDTNFKEYKIYYKTSAGVSESDTAWTRIDDPNLGFVDYNTATSTTVTGLTALTPYFFNIWIYDEAGNKASATEIGPITTTAGNSAPAISSVSTSQMTNDGFLNVNYTLSDADSDLCDIISYQYSLTGDFTGEEATMTQATGDLDHDGVTGLPTTPAGIGYTFVWDAAADLGDFHSHTVYIRGKASDGTDDSGYFTSSALSVDVKKPEISNVTAIQATDGSKMVTINYDLLDDSTAFILVEADISNDGGFTWTVPKTTLAGNIGINQVIGANTITWNAETDFSAQENANMMVRVRAKDVFQNQSNYVASSGFEIDTLNPAGLVALVSSNITASSVDLSWSQVTENNFDHYEIWYGQTQSEVQNRLGSVSEQLVNNQATVSDTISSLSSSALYYFKIWAVDSFGNEETVADISATTSVLITPLPPPSSYSPPPPPSDTVAPIGTSVVVNDGANSTSSVNVTLSLNASDPSTPIQMMVANTSDFAGSVWITYVNTKLWTLTSGDGTKTVYAKFRDSKGNTSSVVSDSIILNTNIQQELITKKISNISGGTISTLDGSIRIDIPAGATNESINVELSQNSGATNIVGNNIFLTGFDAQAFFVSTGALVTGFNKNLTITIKYTDQQILTNNVDRNTLQLYYFNTTNQSWVLIPSTNDTLNGIITASINHFTTYAIFGKPKMATTPTPEPISQPGVTVGGTYDYQLIYQSPYPANLQPGETTNVWIEIKNTGTATWENNVRLGSGSQYGNANQQRDYSSEFANSDWLSTNRPTSVSPLGIIPGWHARFQFTIKAPATNGNYKAYFTPVADGISWMNDIGIYWEINVNDGTVQPVAPVVMPTPVPQPEPVVTPAPQVIVENFGYYTVLPGEDLKDIALKLYGDAEQWRRLAELNIDVLVYGPNTLYSDWVLKYDLPAPVVLPYDYDITDQSAYPSLMNAGDTVDVWIDIKNTGTSTWYKDGLNPTRLGTGSKYGNENQQQDYISEFADISWISPNRCSGINLTQVAPGETARFSFKIKAPPNPGTYKAYFTPVVDGVGWMVDRGIYWGLRVQ